MVGGIGTKDFEQKVDSLETESSYEKKEDISQSDRIMEKVLDKVGRGFHEGYFSHPDSLYNLVHEALSKAPKEVLDSLKDSVNTYKAGAYESFQQKATELLSDTQQNVVDLSKKKLVGDDTIKVFLNPSYIKNPKFSFLSKYEEIQENTSRVDAKPSELWAENLTGPRYKYRAKELANGYALRGGDIQYQEGPKYDFKSPDHDFSSKNTFIHVNANGNYRSESGIRCYISPDMTKDPSAVLLAWNESITNSSLRDKLYFKFLTNMKSGSHISSRTVERPDSIVIFKSNKIDNDEFKVLLQDFQRRCNKMSSELLPSDEKQMPVAACKIANGISIAGEPSYVNDYLRYTGNKDGKHSWTTFIDRMNILSTSVAMNRLGVKAESIDEVPGLEKEIKKVFREFMLLSKINPDTMLPVEYGEGLPSWAKLDE